MSFYNGYEGTQPTKPTDLQTSQQYHAGMRSSGHGHDDNRGGGGQQMQSQSHIFRSAQASKQMAYEVFGNVISILEEVEQRETKALKLPSMSRSDIYLPDQSSKGHADVQRILESQLQLFETNIKGCESDVRRELQDILEKQTLQWISERQERKLPHGNVDRYASQLFEILRIGHTRHPEDFNKIPHIGDKDLRDAGQAILAGGQRRDQLDREFRQIPGKAAKPVKIRTGSVAKGAERLAQISEHLQPHVASYINPSVR